MTTPPKSTIADMLLNRPVLLPDGSVWQHSERQREGGAKRRREMEMQRKRDKREQAKKAAK